MEKAAKKENQGPKCLSVNYQKLFQRKMDGGLGALVEIGCKGHFPLFHSQWIHSIFSPDSPEGDLPPLFNPPPQEIENFEKILLNLSNYSSLDKKKVLLFSLKDKEREQFIRFFFKLVEGKLLDQKHPLQ